MENNISTIPKKRKFIGMWMTWVRMIKPGHGEKQFLWFDSFTRWFNHHLPLRIVSSITLNILLYLSLWFFWNSTLYIPCVLIFFSKQLWYRYLILSILEPLTKRAIHYCFLTMCIKLCFHVFLRNWILWTNGSKM